MPDNLTIYTPTDILNVVKEHLRTVNTTVVVEGVYQMIGTRSYNAGIWWYDEIKSQYDNSKLKAMVPTGIRDQVKVMVGGAPVTQGFADEIGADGYSDNANSAVTVAKQLLAKA
mgnify:CR=1 FL=1